MMHTQPQFVAFTELNGFQILDMPFTDNSASMVLILPPVQSSANSVTANLLTEIGDWLESSPRRDFLEVYLPNFQTTVSTDLNQLLIGLGMPTAFSSGADFSSMTDAPVFIDKVFHKANLEVTEQGTEAAAATEVEFVICFAAGTPVLTPDGEKPIEQLKVGDYVLARDESNVEGELHPKLVEKTLHGHADLVELHIGGQTIRTTDAHLFFVLGQGWTPAGELQAKDRLSTNFRDWVEVDKVLQTNTAEPVYNLRVADHRTYFIGSESWGFAVWAHNNYGDEFRANRPFHFLIRDNTTSTIAFMGRIDDPSQLENNINPTVQQDSADFDGDQDVDGADFLAFQRGFGATSGAERGDGDSNADGDVDAGDFAAWEALYGQQEAAPIAEATAIVDRASTIRSSLNRPLASKVLIDAAMALDWFGVVPGDDEPLIVEAETLPQSASNLTDTTAGPVIASSTTAAVDTSNTSSAEDDADEASWLADELLERVFS